jgi:uncharacterized protein
MQSINIEYLKKDLIKVPVLLLGLFILSLGISILRLSGNGLDAWGIFHEGLSLSSGISFGTISMIIGLIILIGSLFIGIIPGFGTILNILLVGPLIDLTYLILNSIEMNKTLLLLLGFLVVNFGRAIYISSNLGAGPRDTLYVGLSKMLNLKVTYTKPAIELIVTLIGYSLGGTLGLGLILMTLFSGFIINTSFVFLRYNPITNYSSNFKSYFNS